MEVSPNADGHLREALLSPSLAGQGSPKALHLQGGSTLEARLDRGHESTSSLSALTNQGSNSPTYLFFPVKAWPKIIQICNFLTKLIMYQILF